MGHRVPNEAPALLGEAGREKDQRRPRFGIALLVVLLSVILMLLATLAGWLVAMALRVATGSATVATIAASGIVAPLAPGLSPSPVAPMVLAVGTGSVFRATYATSAAGWSRSASAWPSGSRSRRGR